MPSFLSRREQSSDSDDTVLLVVVICSIIVVGMCIIFACIYFFRRVVPPPPRSGVADLPATAMHMNFMEKPVESDLNLIPDSTRDQIRGYWVLPALFFVPDVEKGMQTEKSSEGPEVNIIQDPFKAG